MEFIYSIRNNATGRRYIGRSRSPEHRFKQHINALKGRRHSNELMQYDFERFGIDSFELEVLEESEHLTRTGVEGKWIVKLGSYDTKLGYNYKDPYVWSRHGFPTKNRPTSNEETQAGVMVLHQR